MPQVVECGDCGKKLRADDELAGLKVRCPRCKAVINVPVVVIGAPPTLDLWESDDSPVSELPPRVSSATPRGKKKSKRRSRKGSAWPPLSRWWTLLGGVLLIVLAFFLPQVGLVAAAIVGAISAVAMMIIVFALAGPFIIEHPFLVLQLLLFGMGISRHTRDQRQRELDRFRSLWPALSHSCLGLISFGVALMTGVHSPFLSNDSIFVIKQNRLRPALAKPAMPIAVPAVVDLPEAEAIVPHPDPRRIVAEPIRPVPSIAIAPVVPAPRIGVEPVGAASQITADDVHPAPQITVDPADLARPFAARRTPEMNAAQQGMQRAQQRATEMRQKMMQHRRSIRRRAVPVDPSQDSATPAPSNAQPRTAGTPGGL